LAFWTDEIKEINTQHSCAFLTGVLAKKMDPQVFSTYLPTVVPKLLNIINNKDCWSEERAEFTDNAIGALGKICLFQLSMNNQESVQVMNQFLSLMPLHHDSEEAQAINKLFLEQINLKNPNLMEQGGVVKDVLLRMNEFVRSKPELEILDDIGSNMLSQIGC